MLLRKKIWILGRADITAIRPTLIKIALGLMVVASIGGAFIPEVKTFTSSYVQLPLLWFTAYLVLSELSNIREAVEDGNNITSGYKIANDGMTYDWVEYENVNVFLSDYNLWVFEFFLELQKSTNCKMRIHLSVQSKEYPDIEQLSELSECEFFVVNFMSSSSFVLAEKKDGAAKAAILELHDKEKPSLIAIDSSDANSILIVRNLAKSLESGVAISPYTLPVFARFSRSIHGQGHSLINEKRIMLVAPEFFRLLVVLVEKGSKSLQAVDFIAPRVWAKSNLINRYGKAHGRASGKKQRVHVFEKNKLGTGDYTINNYVAYKEMMAECDVDLRFFDKSEFDLTRHEPRGSMIIDGEIIGIAINPVDGAPFGEINFSADSISVYTDRFDELFDIAMSWDDFEQLFIENG